MTKQQRLVLVISILASFVAFIDGSVVNVALPAISEQLGGGLAVQQWVVDAYLMTLGALMLLAGSLSDLFGRKKVLLWGLIGFGVTSLMCAFAPNATFLIISRALQGIAGALLVPSSLALIISTFPSAKQGKAIGTWTAWTGIAMIIGPLLGGFLVDTLSWHYIFAINVLPIAITLWLMRSLNVDERTRQAARVDFLGAFLGVLALGGLVFAFIEQSRLGWNSPFIYLPLLIGLLAAGLFIWQERRATHPMLPLSLFNVRNFSVGNIATVSIYAALAVASFLIAIFIQQVGGYTAFQAGMALLPVTIIMFLFSPYFGSLASVYGSRWFMAIGPAVAGVGFLSMILVNSNVHYWSQLFPGILLFGMGLAITVAPLTTAILGSIKKEHAGIGSAVNNAVSRIAGLVAIAGIGIITGPTLDLAGFHRGTITIAILLFVGGLVSVFGIQNKK